MVIDSVFETAQLVQVIDWFIFQANSTHNFDRSCLEAVLGIHSYLMMLLTSKADRLFVFLWAVQFIWWQFALGYLYWGMKFIAIINIGVWNLPHILTLELEILSSSTPTPVILNDHSLGRINSRSWMGQLSNKMGHFGLLFQNLSWDPYRITLEYNHISNLEVSQHVLTSNS